MLAERKGLTATRVSERSRIADGFDLFGALMDNNQSHLQRYLDQLKIAQR